MKYLTALIALAALVMLAAAALTPPQFDPVEHERQQIAIERAHALAPWETAAAVAWLVLPLAAVATGLTIAAALGGAAVVRSFRYSRPDDAGRLPVLLEDQDTARAALLASHATEHARARVQPAPVTYSPTITFAPHDTYGPHTTYSPHSELDYRADSRGAAVLPADEPAPGPGLPGVTDLVALCFRPSPDAILLGLGEGGERITVPMKALWHIGTAGPTGAGKSNVARLILPQLQSLGAKVAIIDPKWTPYDAENGEDWRPIARHLFLAPARKADVIGDTIAYFHDELNRRLELRNQGKKVGGPLFLYADEFTTITEDVKDAGERMARLGRLGRGVGIFLLVAAHDLLVKSGAGDTRDQLRTGYYLGGDTKTGSVLLDLPQRAVNELEVNLGEGVALLRSRATSPAQLVRVPLASNAAVAALLATADAGSGYQEVPDGGGVAPLGKPDGSQMEATQAQATGSSIRPEAARAIELFRAGADLPEIVKELRNVTSSQGRKYQDAAREVQQLLREAL